MTTSTLTLADFIRARLDEDEAAARGAHRDSLDDDGQAHATWTEASTAVMWGDVTGVDGLEPDYLAAHIARHDPARVLAEVAAKRELVEALVDIETVEAERPDQVASLRWAVRLLALPFVDHPDYDERWRPWRP